MKDLAPNQANQYQIAYKEIEVMKQHPNEIIVAENIHIDIFYYSCKNYHIECTSEGFYDFGEYTKKVYRWRLTNEECKKFFSDLYKLGRKNLFVFGATEDFNLHIKKIEGRSNLENGFFEGIDVEVVN